MHALLNRRQNIDFHARARVCGAILEPGPRWERKLLRGTVLRVVYTGIRRYGDGFLLGAQGSENLEPLVLVGRS